MKITLGQIKRIILEEVSKSLEDMERKQFGGWVESLPEVHQGLIDRRRVLYRGSKDIKEYLDSMGFDWVGMGSYRVVVSPKSNPNLIVKFIKYPKDAYMNEVEHKFQSRFENLFPKVYKHGHRSGEDSTDWDWIVMDAVDNVIENGSEFAPFFPKLRSFLINLKDSSFQRMDPRDVDYLLKNFDDFIRYVATLYITGERHSFLDDDMRSERSQGRNYDKSPTKSRELFSGGLGEELLKVADQEPLIKSLAALHTNLNVDLGDIRPGNVGILNGRFVIIDASIFQENEYTPIDFIFEISRKQLRHLIREEIELAIEGKKAAKGEGKPYGKRRRGKTESQAQQMAAGIALRAREEGTKDAAIEKLQGAPKEMAKMSLKDLRKLATIRRGSEVPDSTKKGHERAVLPGHVKPPKKRKKKRKS